MQIRAISNKVEKRNKENWNLDLAISNLNTEVEKIIEIPMKLTLGFSPCPNDTFIFDALVHHKIDTEGLEFEVVFADVEQLK